MTVSKSRYSAAPRTQQDDVKTVRIPAIGSLLFRGTSADKDQRFVNCYFDVLKNQETGKSHYYLVKRSGLTRTGGLQPSAGAATARGAFSWNGHVFSVYGNKLYCDSTQLSVTFTTSTGLCGFASTRPGAGTQYLGINDGVKLYLVASDNSTVTTVTCPTPNTRDLVYIDGYFALLKPDFSVWTCDVDDPTTWQNDHFLTAQMYEGSGVGLGHQNNLLFVFGSKSTQVFYDNANATGSPFNNYEQGVQQLGCASTDTIVQAENFLTFVSTSETGGFAVWTIEGVSGLKKVSTPALERILKAEVTSIGSTYAFGLRDGGKFFYVLNLPSSSRTFVYDFDNDLWVEWQVAGGTTKWPIVDMIQHLDTTLCVHGTNGWIYQLLPSVYQDDSTNFTVLSRIARTDFDTTKRKFIRRLEIIGDQQASTCNVLLQYSDDDYTTLSSARTLDMSQNRVMATNFGSFRRRAFQISFTGNTPFRYESIELEISLGQA